MRRLLIEPIGNGAELIGDEHFLGETEREQDAGNGEALREAGPARIE